MAQKYDINDPRLSFGTQAYADRMAARRKQMQSLLDGVEAVEREAIRRARADAAQRQADWAAKQAAIRAQELIRQALEREKEARIAELAGPLLDLETELDCSETESPWYEYSGKRGVYKMVLNFGKHSGKDLADVPEDYIAWLIDTRRKELATYEGELARRKAVEEAQQSDLEKLVTAGYRALAQKVHPDKGGSASEFQALQAAYEQAKVILQEVKAVTGGGK